MLSDLEIVIGISNLARMILFRFIGSWFVVFGIIALVFDATKALGNTSWIDSTSIATHWTNLHDKSFTSAGTFFDQKGMGFLWDPVLVFLLAQPAWLVLLAFGVLFYLLGRKRKKVHIYTN